MLAVVGMGSHDENMPPGVLDNKDAINVDETMPEELQGDDEIRHYKKGMWTVSELLVLQAVRREDFERQAKGGSREKHRSASTLLTLSPCPPPVSMCEWNVRGGFCICVSELCT